MEPGAGVRPLRDRAGGRLDDDARRLEGWLNKGMQGTMAVYGKSFRPADRSFPAGSRRKSVITLLLNYFPAVQEQPEAPQIAKYAYGNDYHEVIRGRAEGVAGEDKDGYRGSGRSGLCGQRPGAGTKLGGAERAGMGGQEREPAE